MCGRYLLTSAPEAVRALFGVDENPDFPPRYNIAPAQPIAIVCEEGGARVLRLMRWGLVPAWVKDPADFSLLINARAETVRDKPSFRAAIRHRRCLVPADGYYEWRAEGARKQPLLIAPENRGPIAFAALCETWSGPHGEEMDSVAIITVPASADLADIHDRMPAIIAPHDFALWLDCKNGDLDAALALLKPAAQGTLRFRPVSPKINRAADDHAGLIAPYAPPRTVAQPPAPAGKSASKPVRKKPKRRDEGQGSLF